MLEPGYIRQIERTIGRGLTPSDLQEVSAVEALAPGQLDVARQLARSHTVMCVVYLRALVRGLELRDAMRSLEALR